MSSDKETSQKDSSSSSGENLDYSKDPPKIELPNIYPVEWTVEDQRLYDLFERAKREVWNPSSIPWDTLNPKDYDDRQKTAMAYWWALLSNFENSGPPVFAKAMIHTFEIHEEDPVKKMFASIVMDECRHDECCMRPATNSARTFCKDGNQRQLSTKKHFATFAGFTTTVHDTGVATAQRTLATLGQSYFPHSCLGSVALQPYSAR